MKTNDMQEVGGNHYERFQIEPVDIMAHFSLNWFQGEALKYVSRHWFKNGEQDIDKAIHVLEIADKLKPLTIKHESWEFGPGTIMQDYVDQYAKNMLIGVYFGTDDNCSGHQWVIGIFNIIFGEYREASECIKKYKKLYYGTKSKD